MMKASDNFNKGGWFAVWSGLADGSVKPSDAARLADDLMRNQVGRPPLDPFWLEGASSLNQTKVSSAVRVQTALAWLENSISYDSWDPGRVGFEMLYLLNTKFISWSDKADWKNNCETFAEAAVFTLRRPEIFEWHFDWKQLRNDWWSNLMENHTTIAAQPLEALEKNRENWSEKEIELAEIAMDVWSRKPEKKSHLELGSSLVTEALLSSWEKTVLGYRHKENLHNAVKPTL